MTAPHADHGNHTCITILLLLALGLFAACASAAVVWKSRHDGDQSVHQNRTPMPYHQAFSH
jgi:hypothetical protein